ncbi:MAG: DMT family transporter [Acidobacteria bacterium]|nr:DMT family transporter [Acidobacteriota bacterium]
MKIAFYTTFALVCFALNSLLCRLALGAETIDAASFTTIRLISGAATLAVIYYFFDKKRENIIIGNWLSAFFLFAYAICFSFAYINLTTATGALILFGCVQATMIISALVKGERPKILEWLGLLLALGGLIYLVFPGLASPPFFSSALMAVAGIAWGFYTLRGRGSANPLAETTGNFVRTVPMIILASLPFLSKIHLSQKGIIFAVLSGAIASGIGYSVWYFVLKFYTATRAAILQLSVPALAGLGGVIFLSEIISLRLLSATILILGGISLAIFGKRKKN